MHTSRTLQTAEVFHTGSGVRDDRHEISSSLSTKIISASHTIWLTSLHSTLPC